MNTNRYLIMVSLLLTLSMPVFATKSDMLKKCFERCEERLVNPCEETAMTVYTCGTLYCCYKAAVTVTSSQCVACVAGTCVACALAKMLCKKAPRHSSHTTVADTFTSQPPVVQTPLSQASSSKKPWNMSTNQKRS